jgi:hypothetical protein
VNNYCNNFILIFLCVDINQPLGFVKNNPSNNFNNLFVPENSQGSSGNDYGVVNNNYFYGPFTNINKVEEESASSKTKYKSSNIFSFEDPCSKPFKNKNFPSTSSQNLEFNNLNISENPNSNIASLINEKGITSNNNNASNSLFLSNVDYPTSFQEKKEKENKSYNIELGINLGYSARKTSHLNTSGNKGK